MTHAEMIRRIAAKTGYPELVVRRIVNAQIDVLRTAIFAREEVVFRTLFRVLPQDREMEVHAPGKPRERVKRILLLIRPFKSFRTELNQWTRGMERSKSG